MAPNIHESDVIEGASYSEDGNGETHARAFIVNNMDVGVASQKQHLVSNFSYRGICSRNGSPFRALLYFLSSSGIFRQYL